MHHRLVHFVSGDAHRTRIDDPAHRNHGNVRRASADVHHHVPRRFLDRQPRANRRGHGLFHQINFARARYAESCTARFSTGVISLGTPITIRGCTRTRRLCAFWIKYVSIFSVTLKSAITPSFIGLIATTLPGVRPSISFASLPTATTSPLFLLIATIEGSFTTMPLPFANTSVFAVPKSMARSEENRLNTDLIEYPFFMNPLAPCVPRPQTIAPAMSFGFLKFYGSTTGTRLVFVPPLRSCPVITISCGPELIGGVKYLNFPSGPMSGTVSPSIISAEPGSVCPITSTTL